MAQREGESVLLAEEKMEFFILTWLIKEWLTQRKEKLIGGVHKFVRNSGAHNGEENFFKYGPGSIRI